MSSSLHPNSGRKDLSPRRPWHELPEDLLIMIANSINVPSPIDFVQFGSVCKSWNNATKKENYRQRNNMPLLMLAEDNSTSKFRRFYSPSEEKVYKLLLPEVRDRKCCYSLGSWVVTVGKDYQIQIVNVFSRDIIRLPSLDTFYHMSFMRGKGGNPEYMRNRTLGKVCLSDNPGKKGKKIYALALYDLNRTLAFASPGDAWWTKIDCDNAKERYYDAVFYKGQFYAVYIDNSIYAERVTVAAVDLRRRKVKKIASRPLLFFVWWVYIVESSGELLVLVRAKWPTTVPALTYVFEIYKIDIENAAFESIKNIGDRSLFVGQSQSFSVRAEDIVGCKRNCVYFTDDEDYEGHDMGVYDIEEETVKPHFAGKSLSKYSPPLWVAHNSCHR